MAHSAAQLKELDRGQSKVGGERDKRDDHYR
jgi:hypothetical protein